MPINAPRPLPDVAARMIFKPRKRLPAVLCSKLAAEDRLRMWSPSYSLPKRVVLDLTPEELFALKELESVLNIPTRSNVILAILQRFWWEQVTSGLVKQPEGCCADLPNSLNDFKDHISASVKADPAV